LGGATPAARSIVRMSPSVILRQVETIMTVSKWTREQLGLQLWTNFENYGQIPNDYDSEVLRSMGLRMYLIVFFYIYLKSVREYVINFNSQVHWGDPMASITRLQKSFSSAAHLMIREQSSDLELVALRSKAKGLLMIMVDCFLKFSSVK
jgi:hypothetical protein